MRPEEIRALGDLVGEAATGIAGQARDVHAAVADRVFGALGGAVGDRLVERGSPLHTPLELFIDDCRPVTHRLAVFVHGLGETERAWNLRAARLTPYGDRLAVECGVTPVYVRYNSGLPIAASGERLAVALDALVETWPVPADLAGGTLDGRSRRSRRLSRARRGAMARPRAQDHLPRLAAPRSAVGARGTGGRARPLTPARDPAVRRAASDPERRGARPR
jgi:hypothetical protein